MYETIYHATPFYFDTLRKNSWLSLHPWEAALHLMMKNMKEGRGRLDGFLIKFPEISIYMFENIVKLGDTLNMTCRMDLSFSGENRSTLREAISTFPEEKQWIFFAEEIVDLKPFLSLNV